MKILKSNYKHYLRIIENKFTEANLQENPAEWLFVNDLRTPFFMLQAIFRIAKAVYKSKKLAKLIEEFKLIEDQLGKIDFLKQCLENAKSNKEKTKLYNDKILSELEIFKNILDKKNWLNNKKINKIKTILEKQKWLKEKDESKKIKDFYKKTINKICLIVEDKNYKFDEIEANVHELRRHLRWLSIYLKVTNGLFKIVEIENEKEQLDKYFTEEIISSPHLQLQNNSKIKNNIFIDYTNFIALSWLINELGNIKDKGLLDSEMNSDEKTSKDKIILLNRRLKYLLQKTQKIVTEFNENKVLKNLLIK